MAMPLCPPSLLTCPRRPAKILSAIPRLTQKVQAPWSIVAEGGVSVPSEYGKAPEPTLARLSLYLRCLRQLASAGVRTISSKQMEERLGVLSAQIRKDLSYFGEFGKPGIGYDVQHLLERLTEVMQLDREHRAVIAGAGNLGSALAGYAGFARSPFRIVGIFDNDSGKIGRRLWDLEILDIRHMPEIAQSLQASMGIIAVPAEAAQEVAEVMVKSGVRAILNFAPTQVTAPPHVATRNVDLLRELEILSYYFDRLPAAPAECTSAAQKGSSPFPRGAPEASEPRPVQDPEGPFDLGQGTPSGSEG